MPSSAAGESPRIAAITRSSTATPSPRGFVRGERNCSSRYACAACSSMPSKPASSAFADETRNASTMPSTPSSSSASGIVGSRGERTAPGATGNE